jgi:ribulose-5-phosphate 4-epimerase/fuculose-1-phosphate aldolase
MHLHTDQGVAVSSQKEGLLPLAQHSLIARAGLSYLDYEGIALNLDERERLVADIGDKSAVLLRNHGTLTIGESAADCWIRMYYLERACLQQVMALSAGRGNVLEAPRESQETVHRQVDGGKRAGGHLAWPGFLRKLDRLSPGYDA